MFVNAHEDDIMSFSGNLLSSQPWLPAVILVFASTLLDSQAAIAKAFHASRPGKLRVREEITSSRYGVSRGSRL